MRSSRNGAGAAPLRVYALGPFRVELAGSVLERWGGKKAGLRQADAQFAFLLHRTLGGLRRTLGPGDTGRSGRTIRFSNDRYRLEPRVVGYRERMVDVLLALGSAYEAVDDRVAAVGAYREAIRIGGGSAASARSAVDRLSA